MTGEDREIALSAIYLSIGYEAAAKKAPGKMMLSDGGHVETMYVLIDQAEALEKWVKDRDCAGFPGVFAYEFVEPLGEWLYDLDGLPDEAEFIAELDRRWAEWVGA